MEGKKLTDLEVYRIAVELSALAWQVYQVIPTYCKFHIGAQFLDSVDSIGANIAEGFGRYHFRDSLKFYYNSRGSLFEAKHWIYLLKTRNLIENEAHAIILNSLEKEGVKLNNFINSLKIKI